MRGLVMRFLSAGFTAEAVKPLLLGRNFGWEVQVSPLKR